MTTFVDTNILVYAYDRDNRDKRPTAVQRLEQLWVDRGGVLSTQVLQEFYVSATRKLARRLRAEDARTIIGRYEQWPVELILTSTIRTASELEEVEMLSFWDALILASAAQAGADRVLTEDMQDGRIIGGVAIENPFSRI